MALAPRGVQCKRGHDLWRLRPDQTYQCAQCDRDRSRSYQRTRHSIDPWLYLWKAAKARAAEKLIEFHLTKEDIEAAWPLDDCCPILGIPLVRSQGFVADSSPTVDRINPAWGYEPSNIAIISQRANRSKGNLTAGELEIIARWMRTHGLD